jgi:hypothetical protein
VKSFGQCRSCECFDLPLAAAFDFDLPVGLKGVFNSEVCFLPCYQVLAASASRVSVLEEVHDEFHEYRARAPLGPP